MSHTPEMAWPIDTDDQVEALARECDWDNRKYMGPADYAIWCERMRKFARLAALSVPAAAVVGEPVAWMVEDGTDHAFVTFIPAVRDEQASKGCDITALYTASRISQQDAELERMRRELAEVRERLKDPAAVRINYLRGDIACQPLIDEARALAFVKVEQKAREWAEHYPHGSDGRNTFIMFAEWAEEQASIANTEETSR